jgi:hypothetical protein
MATVHGKCQAKMEAACVSAWVRESMWVCESVCECVCECVWVCESVCECMCVWVWMCVSVCVDVCVWVCVSVRECVVVVSAVHWLYGISVPQIGEVYIVKPQSDLTFTNLLRL